MAWQTGGAMEYSTIERPGRLKCGNEPGTLRYYYLEQDQVFRFDRDRLVGVDPMAIGDREIVERQIAELRREAPPESAP